MGRRSKVNCVDYYRPCGEYLLKGFVDTGLSMSGTKSNLSREEWCAKQDAAARAAMTAAGIWYGPTKPEDRQ